MKCVKSLETETEKKNSQIKEEVKELKSTQSISNLCFDLMISDNKKEDTDESADEYCDALENQVRIQQNVKFKD